MPWFVKCKSKNKRKKYRMCVFPAISRSSSYRSDGIHQNDAEKDRQTPTEPAGLLCYNIATPKEDSTRCPEPFAICSAAGLLHTERVYAHEKQNTGSCNFRCQIGRSNARGFRTGTGYHRYGVREIKAVCPFENDVFIPSRLTDR